MIKLFNLINIFLLSLALNGGNWGDSIQVQVDGNVIIKGQRAKNILLDGLNEILYTQPTRSKFEKLRGEEFGCKYFFYEDLGLIAYSGPTKRKALKHSIISIEAYFSYNKLYKCGKLYDSDIVISDLKITRNTKFDDIYFNPNIAKFINKRYALKEGSVKWLIELNIGNTQVSIIFCDDRGEKIERVMISLL